MINTYEMMFILRPDLTQEQISQELHKYRDFLKDNGAEKVSVEVWGKRRLAYPIQKFQDGVYVLTYYTGDGTQVAKIEKDMRFSEQVIRYLTIKQEEDFEFEEKDIPEVQIVSVEPKAEVSAPEVQETEEVTEEEMTEEVAVEA
jgi:small subunit ribosomal protein S6